jgi:hypothetical protein
MEDINTITDQLLIQTTELTVKLNMLTSMVLGVYDETLPKETFLNIANSFFDRLHNDMEAAYLKMEKDQILSDYSVVLRNKFECLLSITELKRQWCGGK